MATKKSQKIIDGAIFQSIMNQTIMFLLLLLILSGCDKNDACSISFKEEYEQLETHKLAVYTRITNSKYLLVFESGLGDDHHVWQVKKVAEEAGKKVDVVLYDRAGYGKSTIENQARNLEKLSSELKVIIDKFANDRKVILVGHSLGGLIIRDYAIKNPEKIAALLFVDTSHEDYNQPTQLVEDLIYNSFNSSFGADFGGTREARELIESLAYVSLLPHLPNVPVVVLTSMKQDEANNSSDETNHKTRQDWLNAHGQLKNGVSDFTHIQTTKSGHYIMKEEPNLVIDNISFLLSKLP